MKVYKKIWLTALILIAHFSSHAQLFDDFSDGDFTTNPAWTGDVSEFQIHSSLHLQNMGPAATATLHLSTPNTLINGAEWSFWVHYQGFNASSTNLSRVYLVSDSANLEGNLNGYYIQIGGATGTVDAIDLYKQTGSTRTKILSGREGTLGGSNDSVRVKVIRDNLGNWTVFTDSLANGNYFSEGTIFDNTHLTTSYFGVVVVHSSTRFDKFFFDDFEVKEAPIQLTGATALLDNRLQVRFSKDLDAVSAQDILNYTVNNGIGIPQSASLDQDDFSMVKLEFPSSFTESVIYTLTVNNVKSFDNETISPNSKATFVYKKAVPQRAVIFTEIMADPEPVVALPNKEFVEIYNTTNDSINLDGFKFKDPTATATLAAYKLAPKSYLIICPNADTTEFKSFGNVMGVSGFPSLNNSGDDLELLDYNGKIIDFVSYKDSWYGSTSKKSGGWTLELIDLENPCSNSSNWTASEDPSGGTPGKENSVKASNPDLTAPELLRAFVSGEKSVIVYFSESVASTVILPSNFTTNPSLQMDSVKISSDGLSVVIYFNQKLQEKTIYSISAANISDCAGNTINAAISVNFVVPEIPQEGDLLLNEILFNPKTGGKDFVEIYNHSDKYIDLSKIYLLKLVEPGSDSLSDSKIISSSTFVIAPAQYIYLADDLENISQFYPNAIRENGLQTKIPSYPDNESTVGLGRYEDGKLISLDKFYYSDKFHYELLNDKNGVSLERLRFDALSDDRNNWHSAASPYYATPGYQNSQQQNTGISMDDKITIVPEVFTPDEDGINDYTTINYEFEESGNNITIVIYDSHGRLVKNLVYNNLAGRSGFYLWNGTDNQGYKAKVGYYVVLIEIFTVGGRTEILKKKVVVGANF